MAIEIKVPDIGADEVEITEILVKVGDKVEAEQSLITVEGDKASMEVPSPQAGIVKEIKVSVGDKTQTGALIMIFDSADGAADAAPAQAEEKKEAEKKVEEKEEEEVCPICLEKFEFGDYVRRLPCLDLFHMDCIDKWLSESTKCPVCRIDCRQELDV